MVNQVIDLDAANMDTRFKESTVFTRNARLTSGSTRGFRSRITVGDVRPPVSERVTRLWKMTAKVNISGGRDAVTEAPVRVRTGEVPDRRITWT